MVRPVEVNAKIEIRSENLQKSITFFLVSVYYVDVILTTMMTIHIK